MSIEQAVLHAGVPKKYCDLLMDIFGWIFTFAIAFMTGHVILHPR